MKKLLPLLVFATLLATNACQKQEPLKPATTQPRSAPDPTALDAFIKNKLLDEGQFLWAWASDDMVWTALANTDFVLSIGYKPAQETDIENRLHLIDFQSAAWLDARKQVIALILESERLVNPNLTEADLTAYTADYLPVLDLFVRNPATIALLRSSNMVRYAEPIGYEPFMHGQNIDRSGSGCDNNVAESGLLLGVDYTNITPGCKQSWNHSYHNISQAWVNSTGAGCRVVIVDSGSSDDQDNLNSEFNQGLSTGRSISRLVTLPQATNFFGQPTGSPETPHDQCGHGTAMAGACAAPRGVDGAAAGIAYKCNLTTIRAAADVYLDESRETVGVANAFTQSANNASVKIISMSMGRLTSASQISDAIKLAYNNGKLVFCAAGTSFWWTAWFAGVIFPASMTEAVAVTGIQDNLTTRCGDCHQGSKVDFVVVMEKASNGRLPLSLDMDSNDPSTIGGSSVATASTAGIAALVWSKYPGWTRSQVFTRLKTSANYYPGRNANFGWGRINAQLATQ